jgi:hypothetical protein
LVGNVFVPPFSPPLMRWLRCHPSPRQAVHYTAHLIQTSHVLGLYSSRDALVGLALPFANHRFQSASSLVHQRIPGITAQVLQRSTDGILSTRLLLALGINQKRRQHVQRRLRAQAPTLNDFSTNPSLRLTWIPFPNHPQPIQLHILSKISLLLLRNRRIGAPHQSLH